MLMQFACQMLCRSRECTVPTAVPHKAALTPDQTHPLSVYSLQLLIGVDAPTMQHTALAAASHLSQLLLNQVSTARGCIMFEWDELCFDTKHRRATAAAIASRDSSSSSSSGVSSSSNSDSSNSSTDCVCTVLYLHDTLHSCTVLQYCLMYNQHDMCSALC